MFSSELVTLFTGRVSEIEVFPISYKEILNIIFNNEPSSIVFNKYILQGGMGVVVSVYDNFSKTIDVLKKVYDGCLKKDIKNRHAIRNIDNVEKISKFLFHHIGRNISATNIENYLISNKEEKISKKTILNYFS
jgi:predicted AAA+ superfamily ATPase